MAQEQVLALLVESSCQPFDTGHHEAQRETFRFEEQLTVDGAHHLIEVNVADSAALARTFCCQFIRIIATEDAVVGQHLI